MAKNNKKVAFLAKEYRHLEAFHLPFMKLLQTKGYAVHAYAAPDDSKANIAAEGFLCHDTPFHRNPFKLSYLRVLRELVKSFKQEDFSLVHVNTPVAGVLGRIAAQRARVRRVIYTAHGFHFYSGAPLINWVIYYPIERLMARFTDFLITINREDFARARQFPVRKEVVNIPGVGVDVEKLNPYKRFENRTGFRETLGIGAKDFVIVCVAELTSNKNHRQLIDAVGKLVKRSNQVQCLFVGTGDNEEFLKELVCRKGLKGTIRFLGFRQDVPEILAASDVLVLLSKREGLPKALMEGMASGKPIVATEIRGNRDLIVHGENGILVPIGDVKSTVAALQELAGDADHQKTMGSKNLETIKRYSLDQISARLELLYDKALSG
ncbi:glycosyltransferase family 4 protein [Desulfosporosinus hippei]|uniref:Glycosyltransferase involved in cell wall bisynthesis n=1 Tax=Desulfosporosinus hippei DSM 8344 TaxID=1121419 RepID=A0A1G8H0Z5_9FIRM|nr:glycosyltransferase family 4 protein [Desulfosporosinus hippei]SDI00317.1 Glycosyltransferase involved in cell wall bisynthesis [Desulfosporosinus hippei DSM 8344]